MAPEGDPTESEAEPTVLELRKVLKLAQAAGVDITDADTNFYCGTEEDPVELDDAIGATFGILLEHGHDPEELLAEVRIVEMNGQPTVIKTGGESIPESGPLDEIEPEGV